MQGRVRIDDELEEAKVAGQKALDSLYEALRQIDGAKTAGIIDIFSDSFLVGLFKHHKMHEVSSCLKQAQRDLEVFKRELTDVYSFDDNNLKTDDFVGLTDLFFDNIFSDLAMQRRIGDAKVEIEAMIDRVEDILARL